jgi:hypothetical protein
MAAWLAVVEEFDRRGGYESWEVPSTARWLSWKCGVDHRTARDYVRVARALPGLPEITEAFASGELPYCKVRALTRIATADSEAELLGAARLMTTSQLERTVRAARPGIANHKVAEEAESEEAQSEAGNADHDHDHDDHDYDGTYLVDTQYNDRGGCRVRVSVRAEDGALFEAALEQHHQLMVKDWKSGSREPGGEWDYPTHADAFVALCKAAMSYTNQAIGVDDDRYLAVVHLEADGTGYLEDGPRPPCSIIEEITAASRISCSSRTATTTRCIWAAPAGNPHDANVGRWPSGPATAAKHPAAATSGSCTPTTCASGPTTVPPTSTTCSWCAAGITGSSTKAASTFNRPHWASLNGPDPMARCSPAATTSTPSNSTASPTPR